MKENLLLIKKFREQRYTYREIGEILGVSKQRIHQIYKNYKTPCSGRTSYGRNFLKKLRTLLDNVCQACKSKENLEVHHRDGNRRNNSRNNIQLFCVKHHAKEEVRLKNLGFRNHEKKFAKTWYNRHTGKHYTIRRETLTIPT